MQSLIANERTQESCTICWARSKRKMESSWLRQTSLRLPPTWIRARTICLTGEASFSFTEPTSLPSSLPASYTALSELSPAADRARNGALLAGQLRRGSKGPARSSRPQSVRPSLLPLSSKAYDSSPSGRRGHQRFRRYSELKPDNALAQYYYAMSLWKGKRAGTIQPRSPDGGVSAQKSIALDGTLSEAHVQLGNPLRRPA